ncbi:hypothetical protein Q1695_014318 [Nippostrongylus brasiliensis]|nr:hypothetical protein Q1695_014318 [Nippostrongylus brasiliensis]
MKFFPPFSPNDRYPQLCEGATLHFDLKRQLHVVATRDIPCGEVVCLDVGKVISLDDGVCRYCLSRLTENRKNWGYCDNCTARDKLFGPFEQPFMTDLQEMGMFRLAVHLALSYPTEEVEQCLSSSAESSRELLCDKAMSSDSLAAVLSLAVDPYPVDLSGTYSLVTEIVRTLDTHPYWREIPEDRRLNVFATILERISSRLMSNSHSIYFLDNLEHSIRLSDPQNEIPSGVGLFPAASWFNHSCRANVNSFFHGDKLIFVSTGIRNGEEICDSYGASFFNNTKTERDEFLAERGFTCNCYPCANSDSMDELLIPTVELIPDFSITIDTFKQCRRVLPDGHKNIEVLAEYCTESDENWLHSADRVYLYEEILESQRRRGLYFSPDQIRTHLRCALLYYDALFNPSQEDSVDMQASLFGAFVRLRTFYGTLHPWYGITERIIGEFLRTNGELSNTFYFLVDELRQILTPF